MKKTLSAISAICLSALLATPAKSENQGSFVFCDGFESGTTQGWEQPSLGVNEPEFFPRHIPIDIEHIFVPQIAECFGATRVLYETGNGERTDSRSIPSLPSHFVRYSDGPQPFIFGGPSETFFVRIGLFRDTDWVLPVVEEAPAIANRYVTVGMNAENPVAVRLSVQSRTPTPSGLEVCVQALNGNPDSATLVPPRPTGDFSPDTFLFEAYGPELNGDQGPYIAGANSSDDVFCVTLPYRSEGTSVFPRVYKFVVEADGNGEEALARRYTSVVEQASDYGF